jgi:hypothetical protein
VCGKEDWGNGAMPGSMIEEGRVVDGMNRGKGGTTQEAIRKSTDRRDLDVNTAGFRR